MQIYEKIFKELEEKGISQKELSQATGIRQSTISDWKNKKVNPSADRILVISKALGISPVTLLGGEEQQPLDLIVEAEKSEESVLLENYRSMTPSQQRRLLNYMEQLRNASADES